jgi:hypothetical protein
MVEDTPAAREANQERFETELEVRSHLTNSGRIWTLTSLLQFVQCLGNPFYLQCELGQP